jgi:hypothetical protein
VARPIKPVKGVAPPPGKKPPARRSANDEPNFGY